MIEKIISGGQTGADQAWLDTAIDNYVFIAQLTDDFARHHQVV